MANQPTTTAKPIRCSCGLCFAPTAANYVGSSTMGGVYLTLFNCTCGSTRALVLHDAEPELDSELGVAA